MRRILPLLLCLLLLPHAPALAQSELTIVHVTDTHYLSPSLTDYGEAFTRVVENADGKVTHYTPQLVRAFVSEMLALQPDAVILSGDLTLNGAPQSHAELAALLAPLTDAGVRVLALPGNHDAGASAYRFSGDQVIPVEGTEPSAFDEAYAALGYDQALSRDPASMSYLAPLAPGVWCLLVDVNANGAPGSVSGATLAWVEAQLQRAQAEGACVIAVSHQPALVHNSLFTYGFVMGSSDPLVALYEKYGVQLNLCGHLHMQHIARFGGLTEIAASSLAVSPNQYGVLRMQGSRLISYDMRQADVAAWAARSGETDPNLLDFAAYSAGFFAKTTKGQVTAMFEGSGLSADTQAQMADFAARLNAEYFSGTRALTAGDPGWALWEKHLPGAFFTYYMRSILMEEPVNMCHYDFEAQAR